MRGFEDSIRVVTSIRYTMVPTYEVEQIFGNSRLVPLAGRESQLDGLSVEVYDSMNLGRKPAP